MLARRPTAVSAAVVAVLIVAATLGVSLAGRAAPARGVMRHRGAPHRVRRAHASGVDLFRGLGSWVDIYEHGTFSHPARSVRRMARNGVRTLYLETSNFRREVAIKWPGREAAFIAAAHRNGMRVVAWYLPGFLNTWSDFNRVMAAVNFRTRTGQAFDGFALDIESPAVRRPAVRTRRLNTLSDRILRAVGPSYPLGAIIPTPLGMQQNPAYWHGFPYRHLLADYQAFLPMTYFTWRVRGFRGAFSYTTACIDIIRKRTRDRAVPIHVIGGISNDSSAAEARGFVRAVRRRGVIGASYYGFHGTTDTLWRILHGITALS